MGYAIEASEAVGDAARRIAIEQIDRARSAIADEPAPDAVHLVRKRCKRIRALLRLLRPALGSIYRIENRRFREIARRVSGIRDRQVMLETFDRLLDACDDDIDRRHYAPFRPALETERDATLGAALHDVLQSLDIELLAARGAVEEWRIEDDGFDAIAGGLGRTYARARAAGKEALDPGDADDFHDWRRRVKYHRHHCDLISRAWPAALDVRESELHRLSDLLGDANDLAVLGEYVVASGTEDAAPANRERLVTLAAARENALRRRALRLGGLLFAEKPGRFIKRMAAYWPR